MCLATQNMGTILNVLTVKTVLTRSINKSTNSYLLQSLVDWHGSDRDRGVPHDPLACLPDVRSRGQVHESVGTPEGGPLQLLHLRFYTAHNVRVSDVAVHLHLS